jgi:hypothetical protein
MIAAIMGAHTGPRDRTSMTAHGNALVWSRRATVMLAAAATAAMLAGLTGPTAQAAKPPADQVAANALVITRALDSEVFDGGLPAAAPDGTAAGFARAGKAVSVEVESRYDTTAADPHDGAPQVVGRDLTITLRVGSAVVGSGVLLKGTSRTRVEIAAPALAAGNVVLTASGPKNSGLRADTIPVTVAEQSDYSANGLVAGETIGVVDDNGSACVLGPDQPTCATLSISGGTTNPVLISVSPCEDFLGGAVECLQGRGNSEALVAQTYTDVPAGAIATAILSCDKSLCGGGGVTSFIPWVDKGNTGTFTRAEPCPAKGVVGEGQGICVDFRQSTRTNAGDLFTYILFDDDLRYSH